MRDTTIIIRPYFRETTEALASLVATRPARDVLLNVAAELQHRDRPAARRLAAEVAALLSGVAAVPVVVAPVLVQPVAAPVAAKPARKAVAAKRPGDIGWRGTSLAQKCARAGVASYANVPGGLLACREAGLAATGWSRGATDGDGYTTWTNGADRLRVGPWGAIYLGTGWAQMPRDGRDALMEAGRPVMMAAIEAARIKAKRNAARAKARASFLDAAKHRKLAREGKAPWLTTEGARGKVAYAWKLRAEARAI